MALVFSYIRCSTKRQEFGDSIRRQVELSDAWIEKHKHQQSLMSLHDVGVSSFRGRNKSVGRLGKFLAAIESGQVKPGSILALENLDRLSREGVAEAFTLFQSILRSGVSIVVFRPYEKLYTPASLDDFIDIMIPLIYFHLAHIESKNKSDRIRSSMASKRKASQADPSKRIDSHKPSWLDWDEDRQAYVPNEGVKAIQFIFAETVKGTGQKTLTGLLQAKFTPIGRSGNWNGSYISKVLNDRSVLGERQPYFFDADQQRVPAGDPIPGYYPAIIEESTYLKAQAKKAQKKKQKSPSSQFINLFAGLVFNAKDGHALHVTQSKNKGAKSVHRRLTSYGHIRKLPGTDSVSIALRTVEIGLLLHLHSFDFAGLRPSESASRLIDLRLERTGLALRLADLEAVLADPKGGDLQSVLTAITNLRTRLSVLNPQIEALESDSISAVPIDDFRVLVDRWTDAEGRLGGISRDQTGNSIALDDQLIEPTTNERDDLRVKIRNLLPDIISSLYVKTEKTYRGIGALCQINFRNGEFTQFEIDPGIRKGKPMIWSRPFTDSSVDIRIIENCQYKIFPTEPPKKPDQKPLPRKIPATLQPAIDYWLATIEPTMAPPSWRVIGPQMKKFSSFVGPDFLVAEIDEKLWALWIRNLKLSISEGKIASNTARVGYARSRGFLLWLVDQGKHQGFPSLGLSAEKSLSI